MLVGMLLSAFVAVGLPCGEFLIQGTRFGVSSSTPGAFFLLFALLVLVQPLLGQVRRTWMFTRAELLLMTVMMMLVSAIATRGFTGIFVAVISAVHYYASPENGWTELLVPYIPTWIIPRDTRAIKWFYEGLPQEQPIPWEVWLSSLGWWLLLMAAFYTVVVCAMVVLRRQWMDRERLLYPLAQVPLGMVEDSTPSSRVKPFLKNPVMWAGFALPFFINSVTALSRYFEAVPGISLSHSFIVARNLVNISIRINFLTLGLAYLINTGISFSLWFFYLLAKCEEAVFSILGIHSNVQLDAFSSVGPTASILSHQVMGAMIVLVLLGLWTARGHLRDVWHQARYGSEEEQADELLSNRTAIVGLAAGLGIMSIWLWQAGLPLWAAAVFLFGAFTVTLALTRVIIEAGLVSALHGLTGAGFMVSGVGASALGPSGVLAMGFTTPWAGDHLVFMMAPVASGIRLLHEARESPRRIVGMMGIALAIGLVGSVYTTLKLAYQYGAVNLHQQYFGGFAQEPFQVASRLLANPTGPYWAGWGWMGMGAGIMLLLTLARQRLLWWPLHPIGFVAGNTWILNSVWFNIFLAWLIKTLVLKYAGPAGYRASRWFFLGMFIGHIVSGGVWLVVDGFTGMKGNTIGMY